MARHAFLIVMLLTLLAMAVGLYLSSYKQMDTQAGFPWQVEVLESGKTQVFRIVLGETPLIEAEKQFKAISELTLFSDTDNQLSVEAFFGDVKVAGLKSKMVMRIDLDQQQMEQMYQRGARISTLGSGTRKVTLSGEDIERVRYSAIASITYLPSIHLTESLIEKRFGDADEKITDSQSGAVHWLYPEIGVDVVISESEKEVIQYVLPEKFSGIVQPLRSQ